MKEGNYEKTKLAHSDNELSNQMYHLTFAELNLLISAVKNDQKIQNQVNQGQSAKIAQLE